MNHKFYSHGAGVSEQGEGKAEASEPRAIRGRPLSRLGAAVGVLLLAGCSSAGSAIPGGGAGTGAVPTGAGGGVNTGGSVNSDGGTANSGGSVNSGGGDVIGAGTGSVNGGSPGEGGSSAVGGGATTSGAGGMLGGGTAGAAAGGAANGPPCPKPAGQICHEFIANDNSRAQTHYVNEFEPSKNWVTSVGDSGQNSPRGIQIVATATSPSGKAVVVSINSGFAVFDMVGGKLLSKVSTFGNTTSILQIPNDGSPTKLPGAFVLARDANPPELDFVDLTGKALGPALKLTFAAAGQELRKLERDPTTGNFSLTRYESATSAYIYVVSEQGTLVNKIRLPAGAKGYNALFLPDGNLMATTGSLASVITISTAGAVIGAPLAGVGKLKDSTGAVVYTDFFSGFFRLANGNVVAANWLGHQDPSQHPKTPELLEINPAGQLVWTWGDQSVATFITYGYMIR